MLAAGRLPKAMTGVRMQVETVDLPELPDPLQGCGRERRLAVEGVQDDAFQSYGFEEVHADGRVSVFLGGTAGTESPHMMAFAELSSAVVSRGLVTDGEFRGFLELPRNPLFAWREGLTVSVRGRRPKGT